LPNRARIYGQLLFSVTVWGASFVAARMILSPTVPGHVPLTPTLLAAVRFLIASIVFLPVLIWRHKKVEPLKVADLPVFLVLGQVSISIYFWLQYTGVKLTNASISSVLVVGLIPLCSMLVSGIALKEPIGGKRALALALGTVGVIIVVGQKGFFVAVSSGFLFGAMCLIANAICFGIYSALVRSIRTRYSPLTITAGMNVSGAIGLLILSLITEDWSPIRSIAGTQWAAIIYLALICSAVAYFFYNDALQYLEASSAAVWLYLEPVVAAILGVAMLGETIAPQTVLGGLVIMASLYLTQRS
jgi:drug/metabolite transporter (DMT)-like permease